MTQEHNAFLCKHRVDQNNNGVCISPAGGQVRMDSEWLRRGGMRTREGLDELDEREVADNLRPDDRGHLNWNGDVTIDNFGFKLMGVSGKRVRDCSLR